MPNILRMLPPVVGKLIRYYGRLREYSRYPYRYPLDLRYRLTHELALSLKRCFRIKFVVKGEENLKGGRAVFMVNHQSDFDSVAMMMLIPTKTGYLAKKQVCVFPVIKHIVNATDGVYLDHWNMRQQVKAIREVGDKLTKDPDMSFVIFPEGQRSQDPIFRTLSEFKPGAFKPAYYAKADIVPVCIYGTYATLEFGKKDRGVYPIQVTYLPRVRYEDYAEMSTVELAKKVQEEFEVEVERMRQEQKPLEEYWDQPARVKEVRRENSQEFREYIRSHREEHRKDKQLAKECRRKVPRGKPYVPIEYTKEDKRHDKASKKERDAQKQEFLRRYKKQGIIS